MYCRVSKSDGYPNRAAPSQQGPGLPPRASGAGPALGGHALAAPWLLVYSAREHGPGAQDCCCSGGTKQYIHPTVSAQLVLPVSLPPSCCGQACAQAALFALPHHQAPCSFWILSSFLTFHLVGFVQRYGVRLQCELHCATQVTLACKITDVCQCHSLRCIGLVDHHLNTCFASVVETLHVMMQSFQRQKQAGISLILQTFHSKFANSLCAIDRVWQLCVQASVYLARSGKGGARRVKARSVHAPARRLARTTISLGPDEGIAFGLRAVRCCLCLFCLHPGLTSVLVCIQSICVHGSACRPTACYHVMQILQRLSPATTNSNKCWHRMAL